MRRLNEAGCRHLRGTCCRDRAVPCWAVVVAIGPSEVVLPSARKADDVKKTSQRSNLLKARAGRCVFFRRLWAFSAASVGYIVSRLWFTHGRRAFFSVGGLIG